MFGWFTTKQQLITEKREEALLAQLEAELAKAKYEQKRIEEDYRRSQELLNTSHEVALREIKSKDLPPITQQFDSEEWTKVGDVKRMAEAYKIDKNYRYMKILQAWQRANKNDAGGTNHCIAAFSNQPIQLIDPNNEVIQQLKKVIRELDEGTKANLLIHPDADIRNTLQAVIQEG